MKIIILVLLNLVPAFSQTAERDLETASVKKFHPLVYGTY